MNKKLHLSIIYVILLSLLLGSAILFSKPTEKSKDIKSVANEAKVDIALESSNDIKIVKKENINILNNKSDIGLKAELIEDINGQISLFLSYNFNGKLMTNNINTKNIPEIRNIFRFREEYKSGYRLTNMKLNKEINKLYFRVEGKKIKNFTQTAIYSYDLQNSKLKKILFKVGEFGAFHFSPDGKHNAFSYSDKLNERKSVIIRCRDDKLLLNGQLLENNNLYSYSYDFVKWESNSTCKLNQRQLVKDGSQTIKENTLYYNVVSNEFSDK